MIVGLALAALVVAAVLAFASVLGRHLKRRRIEHSRPAGPPYSNVRRVDDPPSRGESS